MNINKYARKSAIIVGALYIIGDLAGILSVAVSSSTLEALFLLIMALALAMIPVVVFPILKKFNETLAVGYVVFRGGLETFTYIANVISLLLLVSLSQLNVQAEFNSQAVSSLLQGSEISLVTAIIFPLGALMFYYLLYKSKLVPKWISVWGLATIPLYLATPLLVMFGIIASSSSGEAVLRLPLGLQEIALALWLIVKGFNSRMLPNNQSDKS
jgi:hypothetical protein